MIDNRGLTFKETLAQIHAARLIHELLQERREVLDDPHVIDRRIRTCIHCNKTEFEIAIAEL